MNKKSDEIEYVDRGDPVVAALTARRFNAYTDAANWYKRVNQDVQQKFSEIKDRPSLVDCRLTSAGGTERLEILGLNDVGIDFSDRDETIKDLFRADFRASVNVEDFNRGRFAIALEGAENVDDVVTSGAAGVYAVRLYVPNNSDWLERADVDPLGIDNTQLYSVPNGTAQILWKEIGQETTVNAIVRLGNRENVTYAGKLNNPGQAAAQPDSQDNVVRLYERGSDTGLDVTGVWLDWMHTDLPISHDKEVLIEYFWAERIWRFIGAECEDTSTAPPMTFRGEWDPNY